MRTRHRSGNKSDTPRSVADAFTLVELLVVISMIALLMALLLPALGAARDAAQRSVCASNMRQVFLGALTYDADFRAFPTGKYNVPTGVVLGQTTLRDSYNIRSNVAFCPTNDGFTNGFAAYKAANWDNRAATTAEDHRAFMGYLYLAGTSTHPRYRKWWGWDPFTHASSGWFPAVSAQRDMGWPNDEPPTASLKATQPSKLFVLKDLSYYAPLGGVPNPHNFLPQIASHRKRGGANALGTNVSFLDGHVEWHNITSGKSWLINGSIPDAQGDSTTANAGLWTPSFAAPTTAQLLSP